MTCCVNAASSAGAGVCPFGAAAVFGAAVVLFAAIEDVSLEPEVPAEADVPPAIDGVFDAVESALVDAPDELGGGDERAMESVEREYVSLDVVVDAVPGLR